MWVHVSVVGEKLFYCFSYDRGMVIFDLGWALVAIHKNRESKHPAMQIQPYLHKHSPIDLTFSTISILFLHTPTPFCTMFPCLPWQTAQRNSVNPRVFFSLFRCQMVLQCCVLPCLRLMCWCCCFRGTVAYQRDTLDVLRNVFHK